MGLLKSINEQIKARNSEILEQRMLVMYHQEQHRGNKTIECPVGNNHTASVMLTDKLLTGCCSKCHIFVTVYNPKDQRKEP